MFVAQRFHHWRLITGVGVVSCLCPSFVKCGGLVAMSCWAVATGAVPRLRLHQRWASRQLVRLSGSPPCATGMSSSTSGEPGSPWVNRLLTGPPQRWHVSSSLRTMARILLRVVLFDLRGLLMRVTLRG